MVSTRNQYVTVVYVVMSVSSTFSSTSVHISLSLSHSLPICYRLVCVWLQMNGEIMRKLMYIKEILYCIGIMCCIRFETAVNGQKVRLCLSCISCCVFPSMSFTYICRKQGDSTTLEFRLYILKFENIQDFSRWFCLVFVFLPKYGPILMKFWYVVANRLDICNNLLVRNLSWKSVWTSMYICYCASFDR